MGYNARNDEIRDNVTRMRRGWEAQRDALASQRLFVVLAEDCLRANFKTPLVGYRLR
jgi:hypothetical protein